MLTIIGKIGCTKCIELKDKLTKEGIEHYYYVFSEMPISVRRLYGVIIRNENNGHFPLVLDDEGNVIKGFNE